jgi:hypothetical protein
MSKNKGKPSGKYAEEKTSPGRKADYKRSGWPEDYSTQYVEDATRRRQGSSAEPEELPRRSGSGRHRKAGSPK